MDLTGLFGGFLELLSAINEHPEEYIIIAFLCILLYMAVYRRYIYSIFDPFFMAILSAAFCAADVLFMYKFDLMAPDPEKNIMEFFTTEVAFLSGMSFVRPINFNLSGTIKTVENIGFQKFVFCVFSSLFLMIQAISVCFIGLPVFSGGPRLAYYTGGLGAIPILSNAMMPVIALLAIHILCHPKRNLFWIYLLSLLDILGVFVFLFGTGAKSGILVLVEMVFFYLLYIRGNQNIVNITDKLKKKMKQLFLIAFAAVFIVLYIQGSENVILSFFVRLIAFGDMFSYWYSADFTHYVTVDNYISDGLMGILAAIRIIDYNAVPTGISQQVLLYYAPPTTVSIPMGPNPRHNILGNVYFGFWGAIFFSFALGFIASWVRNKLFYSMRSNLIKYIFYVQLNLFVCTFLYGGFFGSGFYSLFYMYTIDGSLLVGLFILYRWLIPEKHSKRFKEISQV